jgi:thymidylate synthase
MHLRAKSLDDLLRRVFAKLLRSEKRINPTKGEAAEAVGVILELSQPRARLSQTETRGTVFSCIGEFLWYLAKSNDLAFIQYYLPKYGQYSDDGVTAWGAYGPRLFGMRGNDQIARVRRRLKEKPDTRRAVIQLFNAEDIAEERKDVPCTCTLQFLLRRGRLHMFTSMRSNDAFRGLPQDVFAFTMLQEMFASELSVKLGRYIHAVGSLHLYADTVEGAKQYLAEGWQTDIAMPPMPIGDQWRSIPKILEVEATLREGRAVDVSSLGLDPYWADLVRLLEIYAHGRGKRGREIVRVKNEMSSPIYNQYIRRRVSGVGVGSVQEIKK